VDRHGRRLGSCIGNFHELLSEVLAGKQTQQRLRRILQAVRDVLLVHEAAVPLPTAQRLEGLGNPRAIIKLPHREARGRKKSGASVKIHSLFLQ
jgi:hypothetical protein